MGRHPRGPLARSTISPFAVFHTLRVTGLSPNTRYAYVVRAGSLVVGRGYFTTAPTADSTASVTFLVYGDNRTDPPAHQAVVRALLNTPSDFLVNTGDLVEDGSSLQDWQSFFDNEAPLLRERAVFFSIGNHELYNDTAGTNFARYVGFLGPMASGDERPPPAVLAPRPYGTVRVGAVRFFFLNGMGEWDSGDERSWLERELAAADAERGLRWRVGVVHQGPWSSGPHGPNAKLVSARIPELLAAHKVDLMLSGHDHIYERGDAGLLKYIVSGGGGAPLYRLGPPLGTTRKAEATYHFVEFTAQSDAMRMVVHRVDGSLVERCGFSKDGPWDCDSPPASALAHPPSNASPPPSNGSAPSGSPASHRGCAVSSVSGASTPPLVLMTMGLGAVGLMLCRRRG